MDVTKEDILKRLSIAEIGLAKKGTFDRFFFFLNGEVITYNDSLCISCQFPYIESACYVSARGLLNIVKSLPSATRITIQITDSKLLMHGSNVEAELRTYSLGNEKEIKNLIEVRRSEIVNAVPVDEDFIEALHFCMYSASSNPLDDPFHYVYVNQNKVISSDNYRISLYKLRNGVNDEFLIPSGLLFNVKDYKINKISISDNWIHFISDDACFSTKRVYTDYPEVEEFLEVRGSKVTLPSNLKEVVDRISGILEEDIEFDKKIKISLSKEGVFCEAEGKEGRIKEQVSNSYKGDCLSFVANPKFLSYVLDKTNQLILSEDLTRAFFEFNNFKHVMALPILDD